MSPAKWYVLAIASFMIPMGIQGVLIPHFVVDVLAGTPAQLGLVQMSAQLPNLLFLLFAGVLADRVDARRVMVGAHAIAALVPLAIALLLISAKLSMPALALLAALWGMANAFVMPARDGLLNRIAGGAVQRMVPIAMAAQMGTQILGTALAGFTEQLHELTVLFIQTAILLLGAMAALRLPAPEVTMTNVAKPVTSTWRDLIEGFQTVYHSATLLPVWLVTFGIGTFFGGTFVVLVPSGLSEFYAGGAAEFAMGMGAFALGTLTSIAAVMLTGGLKQPNRALILSAYAGSVALLPIATHPPQWVFYGCILCWGMCGGVAMTSSRTIMQMLAPPTHRSRVMAASSLANMGGAPLGAPLTGFVISAVGTANAVWFPILAVALVTTGVLLFSQLWQPQVQPEQQPAG